MDKYRAIINVTEQIVNMLNNDILGSAGIEGFEGWCEDGEVFSENKAESIELMHKVAPIIDDLVYKYLNADEAWENECVKLNNQTL